MGAIASQITSLTTVYSTVYLDTVNIKAPRHWPLSGEFTGEFPAQMASNAENVFIWWRHHEPRDSVFGEAQVRDSGACFPYPNSMQAVWRRLNLGSGNQPTDSRAMSGGCAMQWIRYSYTLLCRCRSQRERNVCKWSLTSEGKQKHGWHMREYSVPRCGETESGLPWFDRAGFSVCHGLHV